MIDGLMKDVIDPIWEKMARPLVLLGLSPNQVTALGMALITLMSVAYLWHQNELVFGLSLAFAFVFDALDGAVARQRGMSTKFGGYFDAMIDRYQELVVLMAIAWVNTLWPLAFLAFSGAILTSYAKARTAIEIPISNTDWPDFFERLERIIFTCVLLVLAGIIARDWVLVWGLGLYALLCHATAAQRARRAAKLLQGIDRKDQNNTTSGETL